MNVKCLNWSLGVIAVIFSTQSWAESLPEWVSSYNANGTCYCAPDINPSLKNRIVATPVGGQSISQVCARIGAGPALNLNNGQFNFPVYHDAQCGNGPAGADSEGCEGRTENDDSVCTGTGPLWDLKSAYAKPAAVKPSPEKKQVVKKTVVESKVEKAAEAALAKKLATEARAKREQEEAALALKLAEEARAKSQRQNEIKQQQLIRQQQEKVEREQLAQLQAKEAAQSELAQTQQLEAETASIAQEQAAEAEKNRLAQEEADRTRQRLALESRRRQAQQLAEQKAAEQQQLADEESIARQEAEQEKADRIRAAAATAAKIRAEADAEAEAQAQREAEAKIEADQQLANSAAVEKVESGVEPVIESGTGTGVRLPSYASLSNGHTGFVELAPVTYDFGGAGASVAGGYLWAPGWQFTGRAAVVEEYSEVMLGITKSYTPAAFKGAKINLLAGVEHGSFDLGITDFDDSGVILGGSLGFNVGRRANLSAGVKYSSFFEGDPGVFGLLLFRVVNNLDFSTHVESGDNANLSLGLRYHY